MEGSPASDLNSMCPILATSRSRHPVSNCCTRTQNTPLTRDGVEEEQQTTFMKSLRWGLWALLYQQRGACPSQPSPITLAKSCNQPSSNPPPQPPSLLPSTAASSPVKRKAERRLQELLQPTSSTATVEAVER